MHPNKTPLRSPALAAPGGWILSASPCALGAACRLSCPIWCSSAVSCAKTGRQCPPPAPPPFTPPPLTTPVYPRSPSPGPSAAGRYPRATSDSALCACIAGPPPTVNPRECNLPRQFLLPCALHHEDAPIVLGATIHPDRQLRTRCKHKLLRSMSTLTGACC